MALAPGIAWNIPDCVPSAARRVFAANYLTAYLKTQMGAVSRLVHEVNYRTLVTANCG